MIQYKDPTLTCMILKSKRGMTVASKSASSYITVIQRNTSPVTKFKMKSKKHIHSLTFLPFSNPTSNVYIKHNHHNPLLTLPLLLLIISQPKLWVVALANAHPMTNNIPFNNNNNNRVNSTNTFKTSLLFLNLHQFPKLQQQLPFIILQTKSHLLLHLQPLPFLP